MFVNVVNSSQKVCKDAGKRSNLESCVSVCVLVAGKWLESSSSHSSFEPLSNKTPPLPGGPCKKEMALSERAQAFSTQSGGQQRKSIGKFVEAFEAAGHDLGALFQHFLESSPIGSKHGAEAKHSIKEALKDAGADAERTLDTLMESMRELHSAKTTNDRDKLRLMSIVAPIFTRAELLRRGFRVSNDAFANARKHANNFGPGAPVPSGGRPRLYTPDVALAIEDFCNRPENSMVNPAYIAAHPMVDPNTGIMLEGEPMLEVQDQFGNPVMLPANTPLLNEAGEPIPSRILRVPISTLFTRFAAEHPNIPLTYQALRSMIPPHIGKRSRDSEIGEEDTAADGTMKRKRGRPPKAPEAQEIHLNTIPHGLEVGPDGVLIPATELVHHMQTVHTEDEHHIPPAEAEDSSMPPRKRPKLNEQKKS